MFIQSGSEYAMRALVELVNASNGQAIALHHIAEHCKISEDYLYKIFHELSKKGVLKAVPGPKHGYQLSKNTEEITLLDIVSGVQGDISAFACVENPETCPSSENCKARKVFAEITESVTRILKSYTLKDLL